MIIAIASQKGGVGKTSTAISLAAGLARKGKRTPFGLLIKLVDQIREPPEKCGVNWSTCNNIVADYS